MKKDTVTAIACGCLAIAAWVGLFTGNSALLWVAALGCIFVAVTS